MNLNFDASEAGTVFAVGPSKGTFLLTFSNGFDGTEPQTQKRSQTSRPWDEWALTPPRSAPRRFAMVSHDPPKQIRSQRRRK